MTVSLACLALAFLVTPGTLSRGRLMAVFGMSTRRSSWPKPSALLGLACIPAAFVGGPHGLAACVILLLTVRFLRRGSARTRERQREQRGLLDGLEIIVGELRVGAHPSVACDAAASECHGVAAEVFSVAAARSRLGGSGADAIRGETTPIRLELDRIAVAWRVAESHGLAIAELLTAARLDLVGRIRFRSRTEAGLAGARATATVLAGLPLLGVLLGQLMGAAPLRVLLGGGLGGVLLVLGTALACAGLLWTRAITERVVA